MACVPSIAKMARGPVLAVDSQWGAVRRGAVCEPFLRLHRGLVALPRLGHYLEERCFIGALITGEQRDGDFPSVRIGHPFERHPYFEKSMDPTREANSPALRRALHRITTDLVGERVREQLDAIRGLADGHSISLVQEAHPNDESTYRFTCFQYAFELTEPPRGIVDLATLYPEVYPNSEFVGFLVREYLEEVQPEDVRNGDIVIYYDAAATHAGRVVDGQVISKWGTAHTWRHGLFEVPEPYGNVVRFFRPMAREDSVCAFLDYAAEKLGNAVFSQHFPEIPPTTLAKLRRRP